MDISTQKMLKILKKKIFIHRNSEADERAFRLHIVDFFNHLDYEPSYNPNSWYHTGTDGQSENFKQHMINIIHLRNNNGETSNYMYFNEKSQRLYLDNAVWEWCILMAREIMNELKLLKSAEQNKINSPS